MSAVADLNPKTLENAKRQFVELYGSAVVMTTYLKVALLLATHDRDVAAAARRILRLRDGRIDGAPA